MKDSIFIVGTVSLVEGRKVKIKVKKDKNLSHISYNGNTVKNVSVGSYIKIVKGFIEIIGKVEGEYIAREKIINEEYNKEELKISRFLDVSLFGHFEKNKFKQGIKEMPLIDNECYLLDKNEFNKLHQFYGNDEKTIKIGSLTENPSQEIKLSISKLFASHIGIFGNTGSGKSNTLAKLFTELFISAENKDHFFKNSHFLLIDFNGEYTREKMITTSKKRYDMTTRGNDGSKYPILQTNIERLEIISVLLDATEKTQKPFLARALKNEYLEEDYENRSKENIIRIVSEVLQKGDANFPVTILTELFNHLSLLDISEGEVAANILRKLESGELKYHSKSSTFYVLSEDGSNGKIYANNNLNAVVARILPDVDNIKIKSNDFAKIKFKILSQYYHEVINGYSNQEHIRPLIGRMFKKFDMLEKVITIQDPESNIDNNEDSNLEILNLKDVNLEMKKTIPLIIAKQLFDEHKGKGDFENRSLHIIVDEAHNILSSVSERESDTWKDYRIETFEEIIKEGRKFSTFLTVSSQRPYDISATIISQLHNYFIHRLINNNDIKAIEKTIAYLDNLSFESIPVLSVGSCFVAGLASDIPIKVDIDLLPPENQPKSETIDFQKVWFEDSA